MKREESIRLLQAASLMLLGKDNQPVSDLYYALLDAVDALEKPDVLYFCDGNKCDNSGDDKFDHEWAKERFATASTLSFDGYLVEIRLIIHELIISQAR